MQLSGAMPNSLDDFDGLLKTRQRAFPSSDRSSRRIDQRIGVAEKIRAISAEGSWSLGPEATVVGEDRRWSMHTCGAVFVEVGSASRGPAGCCGRRPGHVDVFLDRERHTC